MSARRILLFAKAPVPGRVKTRLVPSLSAEEAAELYRGWARSIYERASSLGIPLQVAYDPSPEFPKPDWLAPENSPPLFFCARGKRLGRTSPPRLRSLFQGGLRPGRRHRVGFPRTAA